MADPKTNQDSDSEDFHDLGSINLGSEIKKLISSNSKLSPEYKEKIEAIFSNLQTDKCSAISENLESKIFEDFEKKLASNDPSQVKDLIFLTLALGTSQCGELNPKTFLETCKGQDGDVDLNEQVDSLKNEKEETMAIIKILEEENNEIKKSSEEL